MKSQIISDPKILGGKPVIAGTRISVELVLDRIASGMDKNEILKDYPHLSLEQIDVALAYASKLVQKVKSKNQTEVTSLYSHEISR